MDPINVPPPSPQSPPPPQNPRTPSNAVIDSPGLDCYRKCQSTTSRNMANFRALILKHAGRLLPAYQSLIERRFDGLFPDDLVAPDHPPYADMILTALWELNKDGSSSEEAISDFIKKEHHELPRAHDTMLNHHLRDLCMKGKIAMTHDRCYLRCSSITKPKPNPVCTPRLYLDDIISSPSTSSCSSPSSYTSSLSSDPPYQSHKRRLKRKRKQKKMMKKNFKGRGDKTVQVNGRRSRKGTQPEIMSNDLNIGEKSQVQKEQMEVIGGDEDENKLEAPKQETKDQNEVMGSDDHQEQEDVSEKQQNHQQEKDLPSEEQHRPQKRYNVRWIGCRGHTQGKGGVKQMVSGSKQNASKEHKPREPEEGSKEQDHQRKQCHVVWIGRGLRRLKTADEVIAELEEGVSEEEDDEVDEHIEHNDQLQKQEAKMADEDSVAMQCEVQVMGGIQEKQHDDAVEEQVHPEEQPKEDHTEEFQTREQQNSGITDQEMVEKQNSGTTEQEIAGLQNSGTTEQETVEKHDSGTTEQETVEKHDSGTTEQEMLEKHNSGITEQEMVEKQNSGITEQEMVEKQVDVVREPAEDASNRMMVQDEAHAESSEQEVQRDDVSEEQVETKNKASSKEKLASSGVEERRALRQGLRSSSKKEEVALIIKENEVEQVTAVRRSLRPRNTNSEAAVTEKGADYTIPSKRKPEVA